MRKSVPVLVIFLILASGCRPAAEEEAPACPVTIKPEWPFVPPQPWPAEPPQDDRYWFGDAGLWAALPANGEWTQLAKGEKFLLWSEEFDVRKDETPDFVLRATRLDGEAGPFQSSRTTNAYENSIQWAMLTGVKLPAPGCWAFSATYKEHELAFVLHVPQE